MATSRFTRKLGDSELSYFLPSRADGVNDMYLHLGFRASATVINPERVSTAWAILRGRHPLLAAHVVMKPGEYDNVRFVYNPPRSPEDALTEAQNNFVFKKSTKDDLIDSYLNGPRTLSNERLSYLTLSSSSAPASSPAASLGSSASPAVAAALDKPLDEFDLLICAAHFLGDGMALHTFANDFFTLLAGSTEDTSLEAILEKEWRERWGGEAERRREEDAALPAELEARLPPALNAFQRVACEVEFRCAQDRLIGGHSFARAAKAGPRHTVVPTVSFDAETTKQMLKKCKAEGVSIANALFAVCNIAWARVGGGRQELPMMMYSALNLRPYLAPSVSNPSYWFLAVGYFNVVLPSFLPATGRVDETFWHRARVAKVQSTRAAKNRLLVPRTRCMALERGARARRFALQDDTEARLPPTPGPTPAPPPPPTAATPAARASKPPSAALVGLSLLGNLDGMYKHAAYPGVVLHTLTTGSRQRPGGMLLFGYTFAGRLWLSLGYDENGYEREQVGRWWAGVLGGVKEFLVV